MGARKHVSTSTSVCFYMAVIVKHISLTDESESKNTVSDLFVCRVVSHCIYYSLKH